MKMIVSIAAAASICTCGLSAAHSESRQSRYTTLEDCRVVHSIPEEAGYAISICPGLGGYGLQLVEADGRENLVIVAPGGQEHSLGLPSMSGGGFSSLGDRVEWRGEHDDGTFRPDAMIVRYNVVEDPNEPARPTSYLLAVSLTGTPCVASRIAPGQGQNEHARSATDGTMRCM